MTASTTRSPWPVAIVTALIASAVVGLIMLAFTWPTVASEPKDIPVDVVADQATFDTFTEQVSTHTQEQGMDSPFAFNRVDSRDDAVTAITHRDSDGVFVLPSGPGEQLEILTAPAANTGIATMITQTGTGIFKGQLGGMLSSGQVTDPQALGAVAQQALQGPTVTPVVPLSADDPQGVGLTLSAIPLTIGGIVGGALISLRVRGIWRRLTAIGIYSIVTATALYLIIHTWFGFLPLGGWAVWLTLALSVGSTVSLIVGLTSLLGAAGIMVGALITLFIGNPISGAGVPLEFLPAPFDKVGEWFVPGATQTLIHDNGYFPDANNTFAWIVLVCWAVLGLALQIIGHYRNGRGLDSAQEGFTHANDELVASR